MSWTEHGMRNVYSVRTVKPPSPTNVFQGTANYFVETTFLGKTAANLHNPNFAGMNPPRSDSTNLIRACSFHFSIVLLLITVLEFKTAFQNQ